MALIDFIRTMHSSTKFKIKENFEFVQFEDITAEDYEQNDDVPDSLEMWASVRINYEGEIPESYKALNLIIGDWVESHVSALTPVLHGGLKEYLSEKYPDAESSELDQFDESVVWTDQLDYMPRVEEGKQSFIIEIEMVIAIDVEED
jgi:hypothetical protein